MPATERNHTMTEMTFTEKVTAAAAAYTAARDEYAAWYDAEVKAEYAKRRAADKAAGRDTSGRSVSMRRCSAYDTVMMRDDTRARSAAVEAARVTYYTMVGRRV